MLKFISKIDFLGKKPIIRIDGQIKHKTIIGGVLSIIIGILTSFIILYFCYILVSRKNFTIFNVENLNDSQTGDMSVLNLALAVAGTTGLEIKEEERVYFIKANIYHYYPAMVNGTLIMALNITDIKIERCKYERHFKNSEIHDKWKSMYGLEKMYCIAPGQKLQIQKPFGFPDYKQLVFWFHKCKNDTISQKCLPEKEIDEILSHVFVGSRFENIYFDHNNYFNPDRRYIETEGFTASSSIFKESGIKMKNVEYDTDDSYIGTSSYPISYPIKYDRYENIVMIKEDNRSPGSFASFTLIYGNFNTKIYRKYYKLQNMLADVGALIKGLITVFIIINDFISDSFYYNDILKNSIASSEAFGIEEYNNENPNIKLDQELSDLKNKIVNLGISNNDIPESNRIEDNSNRIVLKPDKNHNQNLNERNLEKDKYSILNIIGMNYLLVFPKYFFGKNTLNRKRIEIHNKIKTRINEQLDLVNIYSKFNIIDKIQYLISGKGNRNLIENLVNPYIFNDENLSLNTNIAKVREEIIKNFKVKCAE